MSATMVWLDGDPDPGLPKVLDARGRLWRRGPDGSWSDAQTTVRASWVELVRSEGPMVRYCDRPRDYARFIASRAIADTHGT